MSNNNSDQPKRINQGCRVLESTKDSIEKVAKYYEDNYATTYPSTIVATLVDKVFSPDYSIEDAIKEAEKLKIISLKLSKLQ